MFLLIVGVLLLNPYKIVCRRFYPHLFKAQSIHFRSYVGDVLYLRSSSDSDYVDSARNVQYLLVKQLELLVRTTNVTRAEIYINTNYIDLFSRKEAIYDTVDRGWTSRHDDGSYMLCQYSDISFNDYAYDRRSGLLVELSFPLQSVIVDDRLTTSSTYTEEAVVSTHYGRLVTYMPKSEHHSGRDDSSIVIINSSNESSDSNHHSDEHRQPLLLSFAESISMIIAMSYDGAMHDMIHARQLADMYDRSVSIQHDTKSSLQTISTYVRLLQRRLSKSDEIGMELLDNVLVQVQSIDANANALDVADRDDHYRAMHDDARIGGISRIDSLMDDSNTNHGGGGDDNSGIIILRDGPLHADSSNDDDVVDNNKCYDSTSGVECNNEQDQRRHHDYSGSNASDNNDCLEAAIVESDIWTTTKQEIEVALFGNSEHDHDDNNDG